MTPTMDPVEIITVDSPDSHHYLGDCVKETEDEILNEISVDLLCSESNVSLTVTNNDEDSLFNELQDDSLFTIDFSCDNSNLEALCQDKDSVIQESTSSCDNSLEDMTEIVEESLSFSIIDSLGEFPSNDAPVTFSKFIANVLNDNEIFTKRNKFLQINDEIVIEKNDNNTELEKEDDSFFELDDNACNDFEFGMNKFGKGSTQKSKNITSDIDLQNYCEIGKSLGNIMSFGKFAANVSNMIRNENSKFDIDSQNVEFGTNIFNTLARDMNKNIFTTENRNLKTETELLKTENNDNFVVNDNNNNNVDDEHGNNFFVNNKIENSVFLRDCNYLNSQFEKNLVETVQRVLEKNGVGIESNSKNFDFPTALLKTECEVDNGNSIIESDCSGRQTLDCITELLKTENKEKLIENAIVDNVDDSRIFENFVGLMRNSNHNKIGGTGFEKGDSNSGKSEYFMELMEVVRANENKISKIYDSEEVHDKSFQYFSKKENTLAENHDSGKDNEGLQYLSKLMQAKNSNDSRSSEYFPALMKTVNNDETDDISFEKYEKDSQSFELLMEFFENINRDKNKIDSIDSGNQSFEDVEELLKAEKEGDENISSVENDSDSKSFEDVIKLLKSISMVEDGNELKSIANEIAMMETTVTCELDKNIEDKIENELQNFENEIEAMETTINSGMDNRMLLIEVENGEQSLDYESEKIKTILNSGINKSLEVKNTYENLGHKREGIKTVFECVIENNPEVEIGHPNLDHKTEGIKTAFDCEIKKYLEVGNSHQSLDKKTEGINSAFDYEINKTLQVGNGLQNLEYTPEIVEAFNNRKTSKITEIEHQNDEFFVDLLDTVNRDLNRMSFDSNDSDTDYEVAKNLLKTQNEDFTSDKFVLNYLKDVTVGKNIEFNSCETITEIQNKFTVDNDVTPIQKTNNCRNFKFSTGKTIAEVQNKFLVNDDITKNSKTDGLEAIVANLEEIVSDLNDIDTEKSDSTNYFATDSFEIDKNIFGVHVCGTGSLEHVIDNFEAPTIEIDKNTFHENDIEKNTRFDVNDIETKNLFDVNGIDKNTFDVDDIENLKLINRVEPVNNDIDKNTTFEMNNDIVIQDSEPSMDSITVDINKEKLRVNDKLAKNVEPSSSMMEALINDLEMTNIDYERIHNLEFTSNFKSDFIKIDKNTFGMNDTLNLEQTSNFETVTIGNDNKMSEIHDFDIKNNSDSTSNFETDPLEIAKNAFKVINNRNFESTGKLKIIYNNLFNENDIDIRNLGSTNRLDTVSIEVEDRNIFNVNVSAQNFETISKEIDKNSFDLNLVTATNTEIDKERTFTFGLNHYCTQRLESTSNFEDIAMEIDKNIDQVNYACIQSSEATSHLKSVGMEIDNNTSNADDDKGTQNLESTINSGIFMIEVNENSSIINKRHEEQNNSECVTELMETVTEDLNENNIVLNYDDSQNLVTITTEINGNLFATDVRGQNLEFETGRATLEPAFTGTKGKTTVVDDHNYQNNGYETSFLDDIITEIDEDKFVVGDKISQHFLYEATASLEAATTEIKQNTRAVDKIFDKLEFYKDSLTTEINQNTIFVNENPHNLEYGKGSVAIEINKNTIILNENDEILEFEKGHLETVTPEINLNTIFVNESPPYVEYGESPPKSVTTEIKRNTIVLNQIGQYLESVTAPPETLNIVLDQNALIVNENQEFGEFESDLNNPKQDINEKTFVAESDSQNIVFDTGSSKSGTRFETEEEFAVKNIATGPEDEEVTGTSSNKDLVVSKSVFNGDGQNLGGHLKTSRRNKKSCNVRKVLVSKLAGAEKFVVDKWFQDENAKVSCENFDRLHPKSVLLKQNKAAKKRNALNSIQPLNNNLAPKDHLSPLKTLNSCEKTLTKAQIMKPIDNDRLIDMECVVIDDLKFVPSSEEVIIVKRVLKKKEKLPKENNNNFVLVDSMITTKENNSNNNSILVEMTSSGPIPSGLRCSYCPKEFLNETAMLLHESMVHCKLKQFNTFYNCVTCSKNFSKETDYHQHIVTHKNQKLKTCEVCGKNFKYPRDLARHMLTHNGQKPFVCMICNKGFTQKKSLQLHSSTHNNTEVKPYECPTCAKSFSLKWNLEAHKLTHADSRPFVCEICKVSFKQKKYLNDHLQTIHVKKQVHSCGKCDKVFSHKQTLMKHNKKHHDNVKTFTCDVCNKQFSSKTEITIHCRLHTGDRPYPCEVCGKRFRFSHTLKNHALLHTNERPYACNMCSKTFVQKCVLVRHQTVHNKEKKYVCSHCDKHYSHRSNLMRHKIVRKHF